MTARRPGTLNVGQIFAWLAGCQRLVLNTARLCYQVIGFRVLVKDSCSGADRQPGVPLLLAVHAEAVNSYLAVKRQQT